MVIKCMRCSRSMEEGFVLESATDYPHTHHKKSWVAGKPEESFWTGLKLEGRCSHAVTTYRCTK